MENNREERVASVATSWAGLARGIVRDFRRTWPQLAVTDALAKAAGFLVLAPLTALLARVFLGTRERAVLTDEEILLFFVSPPGLLMLLLGAALGLGLAFAQAASSMTIGFGALHDRRVSYLAALLHAARHAPALVRLAGRMTAFALLAAAPLLALAGGAYALLLTEHDINYYLDAKPREFWLAAAWIGACGLALALLLAQLAARWCLAIPLVLFDGRGPRAALRDSAAATRGNRMRIALLLMGWWLGAAVASSIAAALVGLAHRLLVPSDEVRLELFAAAIGCSIVLVAIVDWIVSFVAASLLALLLVRVHARLAGPGSLEGRSIGAPGSLGDEAEWRVPRRGVLVGGAAVFVAAGIIALGQLRSIRVEREVAVAAHRGAAGSAPENTLAAVQHALAAGAEWIEIDVQEAADGVVVVLHDQDLLRVAREPRRIWELASGELRAIDVGSWFAPEFADQRVPTLEEVLASCKGRAGVVIELKYYGREERLEQRVVDLVEAAGMTRQVQIMSLSASGLARARALRPDWTYGLLVAAAMGDVARLDFDFVAVREKVADAGLIRRAHARGRKVYVWTVNEAPQMSAMISRGVDVLITDEPALARAVIAQHAEMSLVERLLVATGVRFGLVEEDEGEDEAGATLPPVE